MRHVRDPKGATSRGRRHVSDRGWGRPIGVEIRGGKPDEGTVVGWLHTEACPNVMTEFRPSALFFCSSEHLDDGSRLPPTVAEKPWAYRRLRSGVARSGVSSSLDR